jgi:hypothetical protein
MLRFMRFMDGGDESGGNMGGTAAPSSEAAPVESGTEAEAMTVTPQEIADVLKAAGKDTSRIVTAEPQTEEADNNGDTESTTDGESGTSGDTTGDAGEQLDETKPVEADKPETKPKAAETPADAPTFSLEVEDAEGKSYTIERLEDLPEDFEPKNNRQIMEVLRDLSKLETQKADYETDQARQAEETAQQERVAAIQENWKNEFAQLKITDKADQDKVFAYMKAENDDRQKNGQPLIASIKDAQNGLKLQEQATAEAQAKKDAKDTARKNGALVGGSSTPAGNGPKPYVVGSARTAREATRVMGLL